MLLFLTSCAFKKSRETVFFLNKKEKQGKHTHTRYRLVDLSQLEQRTHSHTQNTLVEVSKRERDVVAEGREREISGGKKWPKMFVFTAKKWQVRGGSPRYGSGSTDRRAANQESYLSRGWRNWSLRVIQSAWRYTQPPHKTGRQSRRDWSYRELQVSSQFWRRDLPPVPTSAPRPANQYYYKPHKVVYALHTEHIRTATPATSNDPLIN